MNSESEEKIIDKIEDLYDYYILDFWDRDKDINYYLKKFKKIGKKKNFIENFNKNISYNRIKQIDILRNTNLSKELINPEQKKGSNLNPKYNDMGFNFIDNKIDIDNLYIFENKKISSDLNKHYINISNDLKYSFIIDINKKKEGFNQLIKTNEKEIIKTNEKINKLKKDDKLKEIEEKLGKAKSLKEKFEKEKNAIINNNEKKNDLNKLNKLNEKLKKLEKIIINLNTNKNKLEKSKKSLEEKSKKSLKEKLEAFKNNKDKYNKLIEDLVKISKEISKKIIVEKIFLHESNIEDNNSMIIIPYLYENNKNKKKLENLDFFLNPDKIYDTFNKKFIFEDDINYIIIDLDRTDKKTTGKVYFYKIISNEIEELDNGLNFFEKKINELKEGNSNNSKILIEKLNKLKELKQKYSERKEILKKEKKKHILTRERDLTCEIKTLPPKNFEDFLENKILYEQKRVFKIIFKGKQFNKIKEVEKKNKKIQIYQESENVYLSSIYLQFDKDYCKDEVFDEYNDLILFGNIRTELREKIFYYYKILEFRKKFLEEVFNKKSLDKLIDTFFLEINKNKKNILNVINRYLYFNRPHLFFATNPYYERQFSDYIVKFFITKIDLTNGNNKKKIFNIENAFLSIKFKNLNKLKINNNLINKLNNEINELNKKELNKNEILEKKINERNKLIEINKKLNFKYGDNFDNEEKLNFRKFLLSNEKTASVLNNINKKIGSIFKKERASKNIKYRYIFKLDKDIENMTKVKKDLPNFKNFIEDFNLTNLKKIYINLNIYSDEVSKNHLYFKKSTFDRKFLNNTIEKIEKDYIKPLNIKNEKTINFFRKKILPNDSKIIVIGDINSNFLGLIQLLSNLKNKKILDDKLILNKDYYLVFTGNFINKSYYGLECLLTGYALLLKNPNNIFICKGEEEYKYKKINSYDELVENMKENGEFFPIEISSEFQIKFLKKEKGFNINNLNKLKISKNIYEEKVYKKLTNYLPTIVFLRKKNETKYIQFNHGTITKNYDLINKIKKFLEGSNDYFFDNNLIESNSLKIKTFDELKEYINSKFDFEKAKVKIEEYENYRKNYKKDYNEYKDKNFFDKKNVNFNKYKKNFFSKEEIKKNKEIKFNNFIEGKYEIYEKIIDFYVSSSLEEKIIKNYKNINDCCDIMKHFILGTDNFLTNIGYENITRSDGNSLSEKLLLPNHNYEKYKNLVDNFKEPCGYEFYAKNPYSTKYTNICKDKHQPSEKTKFEYYNRPLYGISEYEDDSDDDYFYGGGKNNKLVYKGYLNSYLIPLFHLYELEREELRKKYFEILDNNYHYYLNENNIISKKSLKWLLDNKENIGDRMDNQNKYYDKFDNSFRKAIDNFDSILIECFEPYNIYDRIKSPYDELPYNRCKNFWIKYDKICDEPVKKTHHREERGYEYTNILKKNDKIVYKGFNGCYQIKKNNEKFKSILSAYKNISSIDIYYFLFFPIKNYLDINFTYRSIYYKEKREVIEELLNKNYYFYTVRMKIYLYFVFKFIKSENFYYSPDIILNYLLNDANENIKDELYNIQIEYDDLNNKILYNLNNINTDDYYIKFRLNKIKQLLFDNFDQTIKNNLIEYKLISDEFFKNKSPKILKEIHSNDFIKYYKELPIILQIGGSKINNNISFLTFNDYTDNEKLCECDIEDDNILSLGKLYRNLSLNSDNKFELQDEWTNSNYYFKKYSKNFYKYLYLYFNNFNQFDDLKTINFNNEILENEFEKEKIKYKYFLDDRIKKKNFFTFQKIKLKWFDWKEEYISEKDFNNFINNDLQNKKNEDEVFIIKDKNESEINFKLDNILSIMINCCESSRNLNFNNKINDKYTQKNFICSYIEISN